MFLYRDGLQSQGEGELHFLFPNVCKMFNEIFAFLKSKEGLTFLMLRSVVREHTLF